MLYKPQLLIVFNKYTPLVLSHWMCTTDKPQTRVIDFLNTRSHGLLHTYIHTYMHIIYKIKIPHNLNKNAWVTVNIQDLPCFFYPGYPTIHKVICLEQKPMGDLDNHQFLFHRFFQLLCLTLCYCNELYTQHK